MKTNYLEVVKQLNQELYDKHYITDYDFEYRSNGYYDAIYFLDKCIWYSDEDDRKFIEEINDYEPLLPFVRKKFNIFIDSVSKLKL